MIRRRAGSAARRARKIPATARLSDSVPPEVNSTSLGRAPSAAAMRLPGLLHPAPGRPARACAGTRRCRSGTSPRTWRPPPPAAPGWWRRGRDRSSALQGRTPRAPRPNRSTGLPLSARLRPENRASGRNRSGSPTRRRVARCRPVPHDPLWSRRAATRRPPRGDVQHGCFGRPEQALDKAYENSSLEEILAAPPSALAGLTAADDKACRTTWASRRSATSVRTSIRGGRRAGRAVRQDRLSRHLAGRAATPARTTGPAIDPPACSEWSVALIRPDAHHPDLDSGIEQRFQRHQTVVPVGVQAGPSGRRIDAVRGQESARRHRLRRAVFGVPADDEVVADVIDLFGVGDIRLGTPGFAPPGQHLPSKLLGGQHIGPPGGQPQVVPGRRVN